MTRELTDRELEILAAEYGVDVDAPDASVVDRDLLATITRAGHRIGEGHRPFPPECDTERGAVRIGTVVLLVVALGICLWLAIAAGLIHLTGATR